MLRNREFRIFLILYCVTALVTILTASGIAFRHELPEVLLLAAVSCLLFGVIFVLFTYYRYRSLSRLSEQIDMVLHNADRLSINDCEEGELSILQSEITKMTLRIREQNESLRKEKEHLADSLTDIAHQLRTPLTSVNLTLTLLQNTSDESDRKALIRETEELLSHMDLLLTSLLKLSRLDAGIVVFQQDTIIISHLISDAVRPLMIPLELHNIYLSIDASSDITIQGDALWLTEVLQNLVKNCMESIQNDGRIAIACENNPIYTEITIHDSGSGFDPEDLPCLFDRFHRGKNSKATGYGIGLALCRKVVTAQGGSITAKNHPQGGAVFHIRFPK